MKNTHALLVGLLAAVVIILLSTLLKGFLSNLLVIAAVGGVAVALGSRYLGWQLGNHGQPRQ
jgi:phosphate/sulfate permease